MSPEARVECACLGMSLSMRGLQICGKKVVGAHCEDILRHVGLKKLDDNEYC